MKTSNIELPAFRVTYHNGDNYVTSMAAGTTLETASRYFLGETFTHECPATGKETKKTVVKVEAV